MIMRLFVKHLKMFYSLNLKYENIVLAETIIYFLQFGFRFPHIFFFLLKKNSVCITVFLKKIN